MPNTLEIKNLSRKEKLQIMENIWQDLLNDDEEISSPEWHQVVLRETEERLSSGQETVFDWKTAKKNLREKFE